MYCESCGSTIPDDASVCPNCGSAEAPAAVQATANVQPVIADSNSKSVTSAEVPTDKMATAGLLLGIVSAALVFISYTYELLYTGWWGFFLFIIPLLGLTFSIIGLKLKNGYISPKAIAGIILSVVSSAIILLLFFLVVVPFTEKIEEMIINMT